MSLVSLIVSSADKNRMTEEWLPQYAPSRNGPCLCGSGFTFKRCCADHLVGSAQASSATRRLLKDEKYKDALLSCRVNITEYTILHRKHTEAALQAGMPRLPLRENGQFGGMLAMDVRAMAELVDQLLHCYSKTDRLDEFPAVLERLRSNIKDEMWQRKIIYFHAMTALSPVWDRSAGRGEMKKLGGLVDEDDIDTRQVYYDLFADSLSFSERNEIVSGIIDLSQKRRDRLHYRGAKGMLYLTIGDFKRAEEELAKAVKEVDSDTKDVMSPEEKYRYANAVEFLGSLRNDESLTSEALGIYRNLIHLKDEWTAAGLSHLWELLGDTHKRRGEWAEARNAFERAIDLSGSSKLTIFLAECHLQLGEPEKAREILSGVPIDGLPHYEMADYAFVSSAIAIEIGDHDELADAKDALKALNIAEPYFRERRDALVVSVQEVLLSGRSQATIHRVRGLLSEKMSSLLSYLIIKPTFMMSLDVNEMRLSR
jgi:tetratricopeptide (TPR) repeat protein